MENMHMKSSGVWFVVIVMFLMTVSSQVMGERTEMIAFEPPRQTGGIGVLDALKARQSTRSFSNEAIPNALLGDLLWAAFGINRPDSGKRTAPSSFNWQDVDIFVFLPDGVWRYDAEDHGLLLVKKGDHRELAGLQEYVHSAPVSFVYVSDLAKMTHDKFEFSQADLLRTAALHAGHISQNVYLFCASEGLGAVARGSVDRERFAEYFDLRPEQKVMMGQTVGIPAKDDL